MGSLLVINSQRISTYKNVTGPVNQDLFPITRISDKKSFNIKFEDIARQVVHRDAAQQDYTISSTWNFSDGLSVTPNNAAGKAKTITSVDVATVDWFTRELYSKYVALSTLMYGNEGNEFNAIRKPSYVGMVILSKTISTEAQLKSIYGQKTEWKQIKGRFLLASGANLKNTSDIYGKELNSGEISIVAAGKMGGTPAVKLEEKNIAAHTHVFYGVSGKDTGILPYGKIPEIESALEPGLDGGGTFDIIQSNDVAGNADWGFGMEGRSQMVGEGVKATGHLESINSSRSRKWYGGLSHRSHFPDNKKWPTAGISIDALLGGTQEKVINGRFQAKINIGGMEGSDKTLAHDNMPPYIRKYIWERIL